MECAFAALEVSRDRLGYIREKCAEDWEHWSHYAEMEEQSAIESFTNVRSEGHRPEFSVILQQSTLCTHSMRSSTWE